MFMPFHKTIVSILTVLFLQSLFVSSVDAQVRILSSGDEYGTISDAVAAGTPGDVIEIDTGVYFEHDITLSYSVTIKARVTGGDFPQVTIDASDLGRIFTVQADCILEGLRLRNGDVSGSGDGGAILHESGGLSLSDCFVQSSSADSGGGISTNGSPLVLSRCRVYACNATAFGGGIHMASSSLQPSSLNTVDSTIQGNRAGLEGGGLHMTDTILNAAGFEVHENEASGDGGGICVIGSGAPSMSSVVNMAESSITRNITSGSGGGMHASLSQINFSRVSFERNHCDGPSALSLGGGLSLVRTTAKAAECSISFNESNGSGGGLAILDDTDSGWQPLVSEFRECVFERNTCALSGGAIEIRFSGTPGFLDCDIFDNLAGSSGGAINLVRYQANSNPMPVLVNSFICSNSMTQIDWNVGDSGFVDLAGNTLLETCAPAYGGGDVPDPNPLQNGDGTLIWFVGINTQYPVIQDVVDACHPGDEIVVMGGIYVESLSIDKADITVRPSTTPGGEGPEAGFQKVVFWNPTEGFNNDNGHAILLGTNTSNTLVGRPREFTQLANGSIIPTMLPYGGGMARPEFDPEAVSLPMCNIAYTDLDSMTRAQKGFAGYLGEELAMEFWSRSVDDYALRTLDSSAAVSHCEITSQNGFGGGLFVQGDEDATAFINCRIVDTYSGGVTNDGHAVHSVLIKGGNPAFTGCAVSRNTAGSGGIIHQSSGRGFWSGCVIGGYGYDDMNDAPVSDGIYVITDGAAPGFYGCTFRCNRSRFGTVYFDSTDNADDEYVLFSETAFLENITVSSQYGAVAWCVDELPGRSPLVVYDLCRWFNDLNDEGTDSGSERWEKDVVSNYFPSYRILRDLSSERMKAELSPNGAGALESLLPGDFNGDGVVDGVDLATLLAAWGG